MIKIGEFSKIGRVSVKTLRHYDDMGLLKPVKIDDFTSYRYYDVEQLSTLNKILLLKSSGFSLKDIKKLFNENLTNEELIKELREKEKEIKEEISKSNDTLKEINFLVEYLNKEECMMDNYDIVIKKVEGFKAASVRDVVESYGKQSKLWSELNQHVFANKGKVSGPCFSIYHEYGYKEKNVDTEVVEPIEFDIPESDKVKVKYFEPVENMVCCIHKGSFKMIGKSYEFALKWIEANDYEIADNIREVYLVGMGNSNNEDDYMTEIQIPVIKKK